MHNKPHGVCRNAWRGPCYDVCCCGPTKRPDYRGFARKICALGLDEGGGVIEYDDFIEAAVSFGLVRQEAFDATNPEHQAFAEEWGEVDVIYFEVEDE